MYNCTLIIIIAFNTFTCMYYYFFIHYSVHHEKCMEESEAPAKDLKLLQREHQESVQESEEANTKVMFHIF